MNGTTKYMVFLGQLTTISAKGDVKPMASWVAWPIAIFSTAVCLFLWFRDVNRVMESVKSTLESAAGQLACCREKASRARGDPGAAAVLERSEKIYRQALDLYNQAMNKPWNYLPARIMGYRTNFNYGGKIK